MTHTQSERKTPNRKPLLIGGAIAAVVLVAVVAIAGVLLVPRLLGGPEVVRITPPDGATSANPQAPVRIEFNQEIEPQSLESALTFDPPLDFSVETQGNVALVTIADGLDYGADYRMSLGAGIKNEFGRESEEQHEIAFTTAPYVTVASVVPQEDTAGVGLSVPVMVEFDLEVLSPEAIDAAADNPDLAADMPQPLTLSREGGEEVAGVGRWLSPTLYGFYPQEGWVPAATYQATIEPELTHDGHYRMQAPMMWNFTTQADIAVAVSPSDGATEVPVDSAVDVALPGGVTVEPEAAVFRLREAGNDTDVPGTLQVADNGDLRFEPETPLRAGATYTAQLGDTLPTAQGTAAKPSLHTWQFTTMGPLQVEQVEPSVGMSEVLTDTRRISVRFNHPVVSLASVDDQAELPHPLTITPPVEGSGYWLDTSTYVYEPSDGLTPSTVYEVTVAGGLRDRSGGELAQAYAWNFTTELPAVLETEPDNEAEYIDPTTPVRVFFNQAMQPESVRQALTLRRADTGESVPGTLTVEGGIATYTPQASFQRGTTYVLEIGGAARSAEGNGALLEGKRVTFRAVPMPDLIETNPVNGEQQVDPGSGIRLVFSAPMNWETVQEYLTIEPELTDIYTYTGRTEYAISASLEPERDYRVTVGGGARDKDGLAIGEDAVFTFRTGALPPELSLVGGFEVGTYNAHEPLRLPLRHVNLSQARYRLYRLETAEAIDLLTDYGSKDEYQPAPDRLVKSDALAITAPRNEVNVTLFDIGRVEAGIYFLEVENTSPDAPPPSEYGHSDRQIMVVSPYALTIKQSNGELFVWAVDLATGAPVEGLPLTAATSDLDEIDTALYQQDLGTSDSEGVVRGPFETGVSRYSYPTAFVWSTDAEHFAFASTDWYDGLSPWEFGLSVRYGIQPFEATVYTDRPIYRPGHTVHIRGALRAHAGESYRLPPDDQQVLVTINDPQWETVMETTLTTGEFGTFDTSIALDTTAPPGPYTIQVSLEDGEEGQGLASGMFTVAEYQKPVFEIDIAPTEPDVVLGDTLDMELSASYFSGGALSDAPVRWRLFARRYQFVSEAYPRYSFWNPDDAYAWYRQEDDDQFHSGEMVSEGTARTDAQGNLVLDFPTDMLTDQEYSQLLTLDVEVTDVDGRVMAAQAEARVHAADFYVGVRPDSYVGRAGEAQQVSLITLDTEEHPVPNRDLEVHIYQREWVSVREQGADGRMYWTSSYDDTLVDTLSATTDAQGRATVSFTPDAGGSYRVEAEATDERGHTIRASAFTWITGSDAFWGMQDNSHLDLIADKTAYAPGDTARILVPAPYAGMTALMTIERSSIMEHRVMTLQGTDEVLEIPITAEHAPNIYVSVVLVKPAEGDLPVPDMRVGLINLPVSIEQQELDIAITADPPEAGPGEEVTYSIQATDYSGAGVRTELSLALVDKAVLALADDPNPTLSEAFYSNRPLGVQTAQSLTLLVDRVTEGLQSEKKGGGGMAGAEVLVRRDFPDTAYWNAALVTDDSGAAQVTLSLPDNLTTWQMDVRGLTTDTLVGQQTGDLLVTRPLLVRPSLPRFLTVGDAPQLQAVIHNNTDQDIDATVTLEVAGLNIDDPAEQQINVPAGDQTLLRWQGHAPQAGDATVRLRVEGGGLQDAVERVLPVKRFATPEVVASAGQVHSAPVIETLSLPAPADGERDQGELRLEMVPSLAAGVEDGLHYLEHYPYGCTEQTVSRFLPNAVTYGVFQQVGLDDANMKAALERNLSSGLQRLYSLQDPGGGWGWWENSDTNPYLTAYVVQGLLEARKAGYGVEQTVLDNALVYLEEVLDGLHSDAELLTPDSRAYLLFILAEAGQPDRGRAINLYERLNELDTYGKAYLLMTLQAIGGEEQRVQTLVGQLMGDAVLTTTTAHWQDNQTDYRAMSSDTRTTALALLALVRSDPENFLVPNAVRHLMHQREDGHWRTTQETAVALMALAEYLAASGELDADYTYGVALDERVLEEGRVNRDNLKDPITLLVALADMAANEEHTLTMEKEGPGRLYYTLRMHYFKDAEAVESLDQGIGIERAYMRVHPDTLEPTGETVTEVPVGEVVQVQLTLRVPDSMHYLTVEDMLPAGLEPLDSSLKNVSDVVETPELEEAESEDADATEPMDYPFWWYFTQTEIHDDRVAMFATDLNAGTYHYSYLARAAVPGTYQTLPAMAYQMYAPEVFGRSSGTRFVVGR